MNLSNLQGAYEDIGMGARAISLGGAYTALAGDINTLYYNAGGLGHLTKNEAIFNFSRMYWGIENDILYNASIGLGIQNINLGSFGFAIKYFYSELYQENELYLSYANRLMNNLYAGFSIKMLYKSYAANGYTKIDPVFSGGTSKMGLTCDVGLLYKLSRIIQAGASCANVTHPDMGLKNESRVPLILRGGLAFLLDDLFFGQKKGVLSDLHLVADETYRNKQHKITGGLEVSFFRVLSLRGAYSWGTDRLTHISTGLGFNMNYKYPSEILKKESGKDDYQVVEIEKVLNIVVNYAFTFYLNGAQEDTYGNHYLEIGAKF